MATETFIAAAKKPDRIPTILMQVEDSGSGEVKYTTKTDWDGSTVLTNIDTESSYGSALPSKKLPGVNGTLIVAPRSLTYGAYDNISFAIPFDLYIKPPEDISFVIGIVSEASLGSSLPFTYTTNVTVDFYDAAVGGNLLGSTSTVAVLFTFVDSDSGGETEGIMRTYLSGPIIFPIASSFRVDSAISTIYAIPSIIDLSILSEYTGIKESSTVLATVPEDAVNSTLTTSTIDTGSIPVVPQILSIDDTVFSGAVIAYTALGGNADPPVNSLGVVSDGDSLTAYRYYRITADFSSSTGDRAVLHELSVSQGLFRYYGTHLDTPFFGVKPYIVGGSLSALSQTIDLKKGLSTIGQVSIKLAWIKDVSDLIATGYLQGKDVSIKVGFVGLASVDYEPVITGTWHNAALAPGRSEITVKVQDAFKQLLDRKIPIETYNNTTGAKTSVDLVYSNENLIDIILDIYDKVGFRGRYIPTSEYTDLSAGPLAGTDYDCTRTLTKSVKATRLLDELAQSGGLWLTPGGDGSINPKRYTGAETPTIEINADDGKISSHKIGSEELVTRFLTYHNASVSDPKDSDDYGGGYQLINANAETLYDPKKGEMQWFDQWKIGTNAGASLSAPPVALIAWADRRNQWFSDPQTVVKIDNLPPRYLVAEVGDVVSILNMKTPIPADEYDAGISYSYGDVIIYSNRSYRSLANTNLANTPDVTPASWEYLYIIANLGRTEYGVGNYWGKHFLVLSRVYDPNKSVVSLTVIRSEGGTEPSIPEEYYDSGSVIKAGSAGGPFAETAALSLSGTETPTVGVFYTGSGGELGTTYTYSISCGTINPTTGEVLELDDCCGTGTVTVTDGTGATESLAVRFPLGQWVVVDWEREDAPPYFDSPACDAAGCKGGTVSRTCHEAYVGMKSKNDIDVYETSDCGGTCIPDSQGVRRWNCVDVEEWQCP